ncbi:MAG: ABC transporter permease, partial [Deltaproteobacteria bacterium]|nr:ABC transporter permease [Deltaproteobacteria bacterium]
MLLAPPLAALVHVFLSDRMGLPAGAASGLALAAGAAWAAGGGGAASVVGRRLAFYEVVAATLLLLALALGPLVILLPAMRGLPLVLHSWQYQGRVVLVAGLLLTCLSAGALAFLGSTVAFLLSGSGRFDPSLGYELYVARSHLRLNARMLGALFLIVVTGVIPGMLAGVAWSVWQDRVARRAALAGEPHERPRLPATMLMTLISIGGVATGVWALTVVLSVMSGFEQDLKSKILGAHAHGVVLKYGQNDFTDWRGTQDRVLGVPGVAASTPFLYAEVMLSAGQNLTGSVLKGIDTATVGRVTEIPRSLEEGKLEWLDRPEEIPPARPRQGLAEALESADSNRQAPRGQAPAAPAPAERLPGILLGRELARGLRV